MNYSTAVMLINENIRAISTTYQPDENGYRAPRTIYKTLDPSIKPGDYVVIPTDTRHKMTVVQVDECDVDIDFEDNKEVSWIIGIINRNEHEKTLSEEKNWIELVKKSQVRKKRMELKENMLGFIDEEGLGGLPIAQSHNANMIEGKKVKEE